MPPARRIRLKHARDTVSSFPCEEKERKRWIRVVQLNKPRAWSINPFRLLRLWCKSCSCSFTSAFFDSAARNRENWKNTISLRDSRMYRRLAGDWSTFYRSSFSPRIDSVSPSHSLVESKKSWFTFQRKSRVRVFMRSIVRERVCGLSLDSDNKYSLSSFSDYELFFVL